MKIKNKMIFVRRPRRDPGCDIDNINFLLSYYVEGLVIMLYHFGMFVNGGFDSLENEMG